MELAQSSTSPNCARFSSNARADLGGSPAIRLDDVSQIRGFSFSTSGPGSSQQAGSADCHDGRADVQRAARRYMQGACDGAGGAICPAIRTRSASAESRRAGLAAQTP